MLTWWLHGIEPTYKSTTSGGSQQGSQVIAVRESQTKQDNAWWNILVMCGKRIEKLYVKNSYLCSGIVMWYALCVNCAKEVKTGLCYESCKWYM